MSRGVRDNALVRPLSDSERNGADHLLSMRNDFCSLWLSNASAPDRTVLQIRMLNHAATLGDYSFNPFLFG